MIATRMDTPSTVLVGWYRDPEMVGSRSASARELRAALASRCAPRILEWIGVESDADPLPADPGITGDQLPAEVTEVTLNDIPVSAPAYIEDDMAALDIPDTNGGKVGTLRVKYVGFNPDRGHAYAYIVTDADGDTLMDADGKRGGLAGDYAEDMLHVAYRLMESLFIDALTGGSNINAEARDWVAENDQDIARFGLELAERIGE